MGHKTAIQHRLHIRFGKFGALKYTGNLDMVKIWERVLRRADLPILYTQGFNTRPRFQLATALPLGITSECEVIDVALREIIPLDGIKDRIQAVSPEGLKVYGVTEVHVEGPALQSLVQSSEYRITFEDGIKPERLQAAIDRVLGMERIIKVEQRRKRKTVSDLRPMILDLYIDAERENTMIAHLSAGERGNLRPVDVIKEMGLGEEYYSVHRFSLFVDDYDHHMSNE